VKKDSSIFICLIFFTAIPLLHTSVDAKAIKNTQTDSAEIKKSILFSDAITRLKQYYSDPAKYYQTTNEIISNPINDAVIIKVLNTRGHLQAKIGFCKFLTQLENINVTPPILKAIESLSHHKDKHVANIALNTLLAIKNESIQFWQKRFLEAKTKAFNKITDPKVKFKTIATALEGKDVVIQNWALQNTFQWSGISGVQTGDLALPIATMVAGYISSNDPTNRLIAATILDQLTGAAYTFAPDILKQLKIEQVPAIQIEQLKLLGTLAYLPALNFTDQLLNSKNIHIKIQSALSIGRICEQADKANTAILIKPIVVHLSQCYHDANGEADLRKALINAMRKITVTKTYDALQDDYFRELLIEALDDISPQVRREAAITISLKYQANALPIFLNREMPLLNDPDTSVRYAVMNTIEKYGSDIYLDIIFKRLQIEDHEDARGKLTNTFCNIAEPLTIEKIYKWTKEIKSVIIQDNQNALVPLFKRILTIINKKIAQNKLQEIKTLPAIEYNTLISQFHYPPSDKRKDELANLIIVFAIDHLNTNIKLDEPINIILNDLKQAKPILSRWLIVKERLKPKQPPSLTALLTQLKIFTNLIYHVEKSLPKNEVKSINLIKINLAQMIVEQSFATDPIDLSNIDNNLEQLIQLNQMFADYPKTGKQAQQIIFLKQFTKKIPLPTPKTIPAKKIEPTVKQSTTK